MAAGDAHWAWALLPEPRWTARSRSLANRDDARRPRRASRLRFGVGGRAPFRRLLDVDGPVAVSDLGRGTHPARAAGHDGVGPAVARSYPARRARLCARPSVGGTADPGHGARPGARGVRRL